MEQFVQILITLKHLVHRLVRSSNSLFPTRNCPLFDLHLCFSSIDLDPSPRDIRVVRINDTTIQVFWSPIYHPAVERYLVHYNDKSENKPENQWSLYTPDAPGATSAIIGGLKPDAMYNVRVNAEFASTNIYDPLHGTGTSQREGDLSEIHVADIYRRKRKPFSLLLLLFFEIA